MAEFRGLFVTGTDTAVGKTIVATALLDLLAGAGIRAAGFKPVAAGAGAGPDGSWNEDAARLLAASVAGLSYEEVNPWLTDAAVAPHIAAARTGRAIDLERLVADYRALAGKADVVIVEGAGGWRVPLDERRTMAELAAAIGLPVVLVVGLRLGCLSHALLTAESVRACGLELRGWVANELDPDMPVLEENIAALDARLGAPRLGRVPGLAGRPDPRRRAMRALDLQLARGALR